MCKWLTAGVVPLTRLELVRCCHRGILSPLCLPIPPQRRRIHYTGFPPPCQDKRRKVKVIFIDLSAGHLYERPKDVLASRRLRASICLPGAKAPLHGAKTPLHCFPQGTLLAGVPVWLSAKPLGALEPLTKTLLYTAKYTLSCKV